MSYTERPRLIDRPMSAYEFLTTKIVEVIQDEPRRIWMALVAEVGDDEYLLDEIESVVDFCVESDAPEDRLPQCGAIGCVAGWTNMLTLGYEDSEEIGSLTRAARTLGIYDGPALIYCRSRRIRETAPLAEELFCPDSLMGDQDQGTQAHADRVVVHIMRFAEKYRALLEAKVVDPESFK